jgi:serine/threonine protein kinase
MQMLTETALFDPASGEPANEDARQLCVLQWQAGIADAVRQLPYKAIEEATEGFALGNRLASGGSCTVFSGTLYGLPVATKQLHADADAWNNAQFEAEHMALCKVSHVHICGLLAYSVDGPERCLVLELCRGGALDTRLACIAVGQGAQPEPLLWYHRLRIVLGIASALEYLHSRNLLHRDLKTANGTNN